MDGLSAAASIIAVIQITKEVTSYIVGAAGAPKDRRRLRQEIQACESVLLQLYDCADADDADESEDADGNGDTNEHDGTGGGRDGTEGRTNETNGGTDRWEKIKMLEGPNSPLSRLSRTLGIVKTKLEPKHGLSKARAILAWPFDGKEVESLIASIQREKSLLHFALSHESRQLISATKQTATENNKLLSDLIKSHRDLAADVGHLRTRQENSEFQAVLSWITPIDYAPQQSDMLSRRQPGTGEWLLESNEFKDWLATPRGTLFCPGIPGAGKTILASLVIDRLLGLALQDPHVGVAYVYCNFRRRNEQRTVDVLASILKQLCQGRASMPEELGTLYSQHNPSGTRPSLEGLAETLKSVAAEYGQVFIVLDALDECEAVDGSLTCLLERVFNLQNATNTNVFATSRFIPDIMESFKECKSLEIRGSDHDVREYLDGQMTRLPSFVQKRPELQDEVKSSILESVQGMFLLAKLHLDSLVGKRSPKVLRTALQNLPNGSNGSTAYDGAYDDAMRRIEEQMPDRAGLGKEALAWISCAKRQLTPLQLQHALAIEVGEPELDDENISLLNDVISSCAGLITLDEQSDTIRLVHFTTQEYLERTQSRWFPDAALYMTVGSVTYLSFEEFLSVSEEDIEAMRRMDRHPFYTYAASHWGDHARDTPSLCQEVEDFLWSEELVTTTKRVSHPWTLRPTTTGLHEASRFGLKEAVELMLEEYYVDELDSEDQTPLTLASGQGHMAVVEFLLGQGAYPSGKAVMKAANEGQYAIASLLLDKGADVDSRYNSPPLHAAVLGGHESLVRLLLHRGADVNLQDDDGEGALHVAVRLGRESLARLLLDHGAIVDLRSNRGVQPLHFSARSGTVHVARLLLDRGADVNSINDKGESALNFAVFGGQEPMAHLLLDNGADINLQDEVGQSPLHVAAFDGQTSLARLLLDRGADINLEDDGGKVALHYAVFRCQEPVAKLLLDHGADVNRQDGSGEAALHCAAFGLLRRLLPPSEKDYATPIRILLDLGADANLRNHGGEGPLHLAASSGSETAARLLLESGADVNLQDDQGQTPIIHALGRDVDYNLPSHGAVRALLEHGADVNSRNWSGWSLLERAIYKSDVAFAALLLEHGADVSSIDPSGWSLLERATSSKDADLVGLLLEHGADVHERDPSGWSLLERAMYYTDEALVRLLLDRGADVKGENGEGPPPLFRSIRWNKWDIVPLLIQAGADVTAQDPAGRSPLFYAVGWGAEDAVRVMLDAGADPNCCDGQGRTPLRSALHHGHGAIVQMLRDYGATERAVLDVFDDEVPVHLGRLFMDLEL